MVRKASTEEKASLLDGNKVDKTLVDLLQRTTMQCGKLDNLEVVEKERSAKSLEQAIEAVSLLILLEKFRTVDSEELKSMGLTADQEITIKDKLHSEKISAIKLQRLLDVEQLLLGKKLMPHPNLQDGFGINVRRTHIENEELDLCLNATGDYWGEFVEAGECVDSATFNGLDYHLTIQN